MVQAVFKLSTLGVSYNLVCGHGTYGIKKYGPSFLLPSFSFSFSFLCHLSLLSLFGTYPSVDPSLIWNLSLVWHPFASLEPIRERWHVRNQSHRNPATWNPATGTQPQGTSHRNHSHRNQSTWNPATRHPHQFLASVGTRFGRRGLRPVGGSTHVMW